MGRVGPGFAEIIRKHEGDLLNLWIKEQLASSSLRSDRMNEAEQREQSRHFLAAFREAVERGGSSDVADPVWSDVRGLLAEASSQRAKHGFTPAETATFVFSLKQPVFARLRQEYAGSPEMLVDEIWAATLVLDRLGLYTMEVFQKNREDIILRQQQELLELSTPVVQLWDGIVALPLIGTLDSARTQVVMETLLQRIVETGAAIAIIDITGVPTVDTLVAQHLLKTVAAARLMGADCIISGIRPQIAQTIVHLGVELGAVITKATLADAFAVALQKTGAPMSRQGSR
ncbi:MAG TPA: STAS domain-containing protein [Methylomirabilota bacterium]|nr:STAS domain-containing protein [Methylomirabilota bacterium]